MKTTEVNTVEACLAPTTDYGFCVGDGHAHPERDSGTFESEPEASATITLGRPITTIAPESSKWAEDVLYCSP